MRSLGAGALFARVVPRSRSAPTVTSLRFLVRVPWLGLRNMLPSWSAWSRLGGGEENPPSMYPNSMVGKALYAFLNLSMTEEDCNSALRRSLCSLRSLCIRSSSVIDGSLWIKLPWELCIGQLDKGGLCSWSLSIVSDGDFIFLSEATHEWEGGDWNAILSTQLVKYSSRCPRFLELAHWAIESTFFNSFRSWLNSIPGRLVGNDVICKLQWTTNRASGLITPVRTVIGRSYTTRIPPFKSKWNTVWRCYQSKETVQLKQ